MKGGALKRISLMIVMFIGVSMLEKPLYAVPDPLSMPNTSPDTTDLNTLPLAFAYPGGRLNVKVQYSDLYGIGMAGKLDQMLGQSNAVALDAEYGQREERFNGTWGIALSSRQFVKLTAEELTQHVPFTYASGTVSQDVYQDAYGATYRYYFLNNVIRDVTLNGYYAQAESKDLKMFTSLTDNLITNICRRIAGATSIGGAIESTIQPIKNILIHLGILYDSMKYNQRYSLTDTKNRRELGVNASLDALLTPYLQCSILVSQRAIYDEYGGQLKWLFHRYANPMELSFSVDHVVSHTSISNNTIYLLNLSFSLMGSPKNRRHYSVAPLMQPDLLTWVDSPAVYMLQVESVADTASEQTGSSPTPLLAPVVTGAVPNSGTTLGGTVVNISGSNFTGATSVTFGGTSVQSITVINDSTLQVITGPRLQGVVDIVVTTPNGTGTLVNGYTYT